MRSVTLWPSPSSGVHVPGRVPFLQVLRPRAAAENIANAELLDLRRLLASCIFARSCSCFMSCTCRLTCRLTCLLTCLCGRLPVPCLPAFVHTAATFILINVRSAAVGYLEEQRQPPQLTAEKLLPELSQ